MNFNRGLNVAVESNPLALSSAQSKWRKSVFDRLGKQLGYACMEDWYNVTKDDLLKNGGSHLLTLTRSPSTILQSIYPEHKWELDKFKHKPKKLQRDHGARRGVFLATKKLHRTPLKFWEKEKFQREFFDWLGGQLGYKCMEDWYNVTQDDIRKNGGGSLLLHYYSDSPSAALQSVYREHNWDLWRFKTVPMGYYSRLQTDRQEIAKMMDWLSERLSIKYLEDWYRVSLAQVKRFVDIRSTNDLICMLGMAYPEHQWDKNLLQRIGIQGKASQREVLVAVQQLFPNHKVEENFKHPQMIHSSGHKMELDVYIEDLKLAFEYQGEQHYKSLYWAGRHLETQRRKDEEKRQACKKVMLRAEVHLFVKNGVTLVEVPYWWDRTVDALAGVIHKVKQGLIPAEQNKR